MKEEIAEASNEVIQLRQELFAKEKQNALLKKQNIDMKQKLASYRTMISESRSK